MIKSLIGALALAAALPATALAADQGSDQVAKTSVSIATADLNLATPAGVRKLDQRIMSAARKICGSDDTATGTRIPSRSATDCVKRTASDARQRLAVLTARPNG